MLPSHGKEHCLEMTKFQGMLTTQDTNR